MMNIQDIEYLGIAKVLDYLEVISVFTIAFLSTVFFPDWRLLTFIPVYSIHIAQSFASCNSLHSYKPRAQNRHPMCKFVFLVDLCALVFQIGCHYNVFDTYFLDKKSDVNSYEFGKIAACGLLLLFSLARWYENTSFGQINLQIETSQIEGFPYKQMPTKF